MSAKCLKINKNNDTFVCDLNTKSTNQNSHLLYMYLVLKLVLFLALKTIMTFILYAEIHPVCESSIFTIWQSHEH